MVKKNDKEETLVVKAIGKSLKSSPQKTNLVLGLIRGLKVEKAINNLIFSKRRISGEVLKILKSAISNAENNYQYDIDNLFVKEAYVGKSLVMKRYRPRAKGRASPIKKPFSRVTVVLEEKKEQIKQKKENK